MNVARERQEPLGGLSGHVIICGSEDAFVNFAEQVRSRTVGSLVQCRLTGSAHACLCGPAAAQVRLRPPDAHRGAARAAAGRCGVERAAGAGAHAVLQGGALRRRQSGCGAGGVRARARVLGAPAAAHEGAPRRPPQAPACRRHWPPVTRAAAARRRLARLPWSTPALRPGWLCWRTRRCAIACLLA